MTKLANKGAKRPQNTPQAAARASHTHEYGFWHAHAHKHVDKSKGLDGWEPEDGGQYYYMHHDTGHYHSWAQTHDHGGSSSAPHTHRVRQAHPGEEYTQHHATMDHEKGG